MVRGRGRRVGRLLVYSSVLVICSSASSPFVSHFPSAMAQGEAKSVSDKKVELESERLTLENNRLRELSRWEGSDGSQRMWVVLLARHSL